MKTRNTGIALALSVFFHLLAFVILLGGFDFFGEPKIKKRIDDSHQQSAARITYVNLAKHEAATSEEASVPEPNELKPQQTVQRTQTDQTATPLQTHQTVSSAKIHPPPIKESKYYSSEEVLEPAKPFGDWVLNTNTLLSGSVYQIFIQIWILETGEFEKFELIESSLTDDMARLVTLNLLQTPMSPATQDGRPVASTRKLAILIDKDE